MGELLCAEKPHDLHTIPTEKGLTGRVISITTVFKEECNRAFFRNTDHNCCWCKQKLQMLRLSERSDSAAKCNEYYGLLPSVLLVYSAAQSSAAEQYLSGQNHSPHLIWDVSDIKPFTLLSTDRSSRNYPSSHCKKHLPSFISRSTATLISMPLVHTEQTTTV